MRHRRYVDPTSCGLTWLESHSAKVLDQGRPCTIAAPAVLSGCGAFFGSEGARTPWFIAAFKDGKATPYFLAGYEVDLRAVLESAGMREVGEG
jgi:hypothetical protein